MSKKDVYFTVAFVIVVVFSAAATLTVFGPRLAERYRIEDAVRSEQPAMYRVVKDCGKKSVTGLRAPLGFNEVEFVACLRERGYDVRDNR